MTRTASDIQTIAPVGQEDWQQIIGAYDQLVDRMRQSHEKLGQEVIRLQEALASVNADLQRSRRLAALGQMAAGIAHEVRNPLASIHLYADLLRTDLENRPDQQQLAGKIIEAVRGLDLVVCDVLTYSRSLQVRPVPVQIEAMLERVIACIQPMMQGGDFRVVMDVAEEALEARLDPDLMHQALVNLARNAIEAMDKSGCLTLAARRASGGIIELEVRDTGPGISEEDIDHIFNPFFTTRASGTGLGLAIVHRIVDAHGGSIAVHNSPGRTGAEFLLGFPQQDQKSDASDTEVEPS